MNQTKKTKTSTTTTTTSTFSKIPTSPYGFNLAKNWDSTIAFFCILKDVVPKNGLEKEDEERKQKIIGYQQDSKNTLELVEIVALETIGNYAIGRKGFFDHKTIIMNKYPGISKQHALLDVEQDGMAFIQDHGSTNGTILIAEKIVKKLKQNQWWQVKHSQILCFGHTLVRLLWREQLILSKQYNSFLEKYSSLIHKIEAKIDDEEMHEQDTLPMNEELDEEEGLSLATQAYQLHDTKKLDFKEVLETPVHKLKSVSKNLYDMETQPYFKEPIRLDEDEDDDEQATQAFVKPPLKSFMNAEEIKETPEKITKQQPEHTDTTPTKFTETTNTSVTNLASTALDAREENHDIKEKSIEEIIKTPDQRIRLELQAPLSATPISKKNATNADDMEEDDDITPSNLIPFPPASLKTRNNTDVILLQTLEVGPEELFPIKDVKEAVVQEKKITTFDDHISPALISVHSNSTPTAPPATNSFPQPSSGNFENIQFSATKPTEEKEETKKLVENEEKEHEETKVEQKQEETKVEQKQEVEEKEEELEDGDETDSDLEMEAKNDAEDNEDVESVDLSKDSPNMGPTVVKTANTVFDEIEEATVAVPETDSSGEIECSNDVVRVIHQLKQKDAKAEEIIQSKVIRRAILNEVLEEKKKHSQGCDVVRENPEFSPLLNSPENKEKSPETNQIDLNITSEPKEQNEKSITEEMKQPDKTEIIAESKDIENKKEEVPVTNDESTPDIVMEEVPPIETLAVENISIEQVTSKDMQLMPKIEQTLEVPLELRKEAPPNDRDEENIVSKEPETVQVSQNKSQQSGSSQTSSQKAKRNVSRKRKQKVEEDLHEETTPNKSDEIQKAEVAASSTIQEKEATAVEETETQTGKRKRRRVTAPAATSTQESIITSTPPTTSSQPRGRKKHKEADENDDNVSEFQHPRIMFTRITPTAAQKKSIERLGGTITEDVTKATHLVTDKIYRTVKFLCALGSADYIVNISWVDDSNRAKKFLKEDEYILRDENAEKQFQTTLKEAFDRRKVLRNEDKKLFTNLVFYITTSVLPKPEEMAEIILTNGGMVSKTGREKDCIIITCPEDAAICKELKRKFKIPEDHFYSKEYVLTHVLHQSLEQSHRFLLQVQ